MINEIKRLRLEKKWSQKELAKRAGVIQNQLSNYETDKIKPSLPVIKKLARALGVDYTVLTSEPGTNQVTEKHDPEISDQYVRDLFEAALPLLDQRSKSLLSELIQLLKFKMEIKRYSAMLLNAIPKNVA